MLTTVNSKKNLWFWLPGLACNSDVDGAEKCQLRADIKLIPPLFLNS